MQSHRCLTNTFRLLLVLTLAHVVLSQPAFAKKEPKTYPEVGKVTGIGSRKTTVYTRTYKIATDTKTFELECDSSPVMYPTNPECGGDKKLQIGDEVHFRTEKGWAYIPITETNQETGKQHSDEEKLRILNEDLKPDAKPADSK